MSLHLFYRTHEIKYYFLNEMVLHLLFNKLLHSKCQKDSATSLLYSGYSEGSTEFSGVKAEG